MGNAATQIANWKGARVIGATRGQAPVAGAAAVIDTGTGQIRERVLELTDGRGADAVFDTVGGAMFEPALRSLRRGGRQVAIASTGEQRVSFNLVDFYHNQSRVIGFDSYGYSPRDTAEVLDGLRPGFESGALVPLPVEVARFEDAVDGYRIAAAGHGKIVISFF